MPPRSPHRERTLRASAALAPDKTAKRWRNEIDIYLGDDVRAARRWGIREVRIHWSAPGD